MKITAKTSSNENEKNEFDLDVERARLIIDSPAAGDWNMSVDQSLLASADSTGQITLRFYSWAEPTLSLGYFQNHASRLQHVPSGNCALVRRASGGGAIVHDREITYSLCVPSASHRAVENSQLYHEVHNAIVESLAEQGIECGFFAASGNSNDDRASQGDAIGESDAAFLCFQRRTDGDLVCNGYKICGSAQRRLKNSLLQHGSLLTAQSGQAPELPGLLELTKRSVDHDRLIAACSNRVGAVLNLEFANGALTEIEVETAKSIAAGQFGNESWTLKR